MELVESNEETWEAWVTPPVTPYMKFNFFIVNVRNYNIAEKISFYFFFHQNMDEVRDGLAKPNVTELGPFSYREVREKQNIVPIQETISFGRYMRTMIS